MIQIIWSSGLNPHFVASCLPFRNVETTHTTYVNLLLDMLKEKRENLNAASEQQITSVGEQRFSIKPDNPANWIIVSIFTVATIVLLLVVVYLSKHKVNHVDELYYNY